MRNNVFNFENTFLLQTDEEDSKVPTLTSKNSFTILEDFLFNDINNSSFVSIGKDDGILRDNNDSIKKIELLENVIPDDYSVKLKDIETFNHIDFDSSLSIIDDTNKNTLLFRIPSRVFVHNEQRINIKIKLLKNSKCQSDNIIMKFISNSYTFSQSVVNISDNDIYLTLTKRENFSDYVIKFKIYIDNEISEIGNLDLISRKIWV